MTNDQKVTDDWPSKLIPPL